MRASTVKKNGVGKWRVEEVAMRKVLQQAWKMSAASSRSLRGLSPYANVP
jgi:hypothetical protein